jgi:hypothetical protein
MICRTSLQSNLFRFGDRPPDASWKDRRFLGEMPREENGGGTIHIWGEPIK